MKCARPACTQRARPGRNRGLCHGHYDADPERGYVDPGPARARLQLLQERGVTQAMMLQHGLSRMGVQRIHTAERIRRCTEAKAMAIPVPAGFVQSLTDVDGTGTRRRLQALMALGWTSSALGVELGTAQNAVVAMAKRQWVTSASAAAVRVLYDKLSMTLGPSGLSRQRAAAKGWVPALAWDDDTIDDPTAEPWRGTAQRVSFLDQYNELAEMQLTNRHIAEVIGIAPESLARQLTRYGIAS